MRFPAEAHVVIRAPERQWEGAEAIVGRRDTGVFLVLPAEAVEILDELAAGRTVGEAQKAFEERHGEVPDMEDFLCHLESKGLVALATAAEDAGRRSAALRFHLTRFPEVLARRLFGRVSLTLCLCLIAVALTILAVDPGILPDRHALYFRKNLSAMTLLVLGAYYVSLLVHEMAHLIAARAVGVASRIGIGHRLWILVAETDLSGLWAVPRNQRYLPLLAGPLVDATSASFLLVALFGSRRGWWMLSGSAQAVIRALLLIYLLSLLWQCFLFVRTDLYYVLSNFFGCRNLLGDTEALLRARLGRLFSFLPQRSAPQIPARELRVVRIYLGVWLLGRALALAALIFIYIPVVFHYVRAVASTLVAGYRADHYAFLDALFTATIVLSPVFAGWWLWLQSLDWISRKRTLGAP